MTDRVVQYKTSWDDLGSDPEYLLRVRNNYLKDKRFMHHLKKDLGPKVMGDRGGNGVERSQERYLTIAHSPILSQGIQLQLPYPSTSLYKAIYIHIYLLQ